MRKFVILWIGLACLWLLTACDFSLASDITPPPNYTPEAVIAPTHSAPVFPLVAPNPKQGAQLYSDKCAPCHGVTGQGDGPQASKLPNAVTAIGIANVARQASPATWFNVVTNGNLDRFMPPFGSSLSDAQRWDVLSYVYSLSIPDQTLADGKALFQQACASCHGNLGKGDGEKAASLTKPMKNFTDQATMASLSANDLVDVINNGSAPNMPAYASQLSEDQRWALTAYLRGLSFANGPASDQAAVATPVSPTVISPPGDQTSTPGEMTPTPGDKTPGAATQTTGAGTQTPPVVSQTSTGGVITGNITFDAGVPADIPNGLSVTLQGFDGATPALKLTVPVQTDGIYTVSNVEMPSGRVFMASVTLNQVTFNSDVGTPVSGSNSLNLPIPVHATSSDASPLSVDRMHVFLDFTTPGVIQVVELFIITNPTNKVIVASTPGQPVIRFGLPVGATNLQFQDGQLGQRYLSAPNGFGDTASVSPGVAQHQVLFAYNMPYQNHLDLSLPAPLPIKAAVVLLPQNGISIQSSQLTDSGSQVMQGITFHVYSANDIANDSKLSFSLSGQPKQTASSGPSGSSSTTNLIIGSSVLLVSLALAGWWFYRSGGLKGRKRQPASPATVAHEDADTIIDAILTLDDLHKEGHLPDAAYQTRRAELKERLRSSYQGMKPSGLGH